MFSGLWNTWTCSKVCGLSAVLTQLRFFCLRGQDWTWTWNHEKKIKIIKTTTEILFRASWQQASRRGKLFILTKDFLSHSWKTYSLTKKVSSHTKSGTQEAGITRAVLAVLCAQTGGVSADFKPGHLTSDNIDSTDSYNPRQGKGCAVNIFL